MKFFALFAALLSVAACYPATWTLNELSAALQDPSTDPALIPYLENALNEIMSSLHAGQQMESIAVAIPADLVPVAPAFETSKWTLQELSAALQNPHTDPALIPYLEAALNEMMTAIYAGEQMESIAVALPAGIPVAPAMESSTWTLAELSAALQNPNIDPALVPYLEAALNELMQSLYAGDQMDTIVVAVPAGLVPVAPVMETSIWTLAELSAALQNPATNPELIPYLEAALNELMEGLHSGSQMDTIAVAVPAGLVPVTPVFETSLWTLQELTDALQSPNTNPDMIPYLEAALNTIMSALFAGEQMEAIVVAVPAGMPLVVENPISPAPIDVVPAPAPIAPENPVVETPAAETPEPAPAQPATSPLVQIIININQNQEQVPAAVSPAPALIDFAPEPVHVVEQAIEPVQVVEQPIQPVQVVEQPIQPVQVVEQPIQPVQVVETPIVEQNPIDVIAVGASEVNPVDILHPVVPGVAGGVVVGPLL